MASGTIKQSFITDVIAYSGAITNGQEILLDNSRDYNKALAITLLRQANSNTNVSGITYINSAGALYFVPTTTADHTLIRVKVLLK